MKEWNTPQQSSPAESPKPDPHSSLAQKQAQLARRAWQRRRLSFLLQMYEDNYRLLEKLIGDARNYSGAHLAHAPSQPPLWLELIEQQPFTTVFRLTQSFKKTNGAIVFDPNAFVRVYHDTKQAEITHCLINDNWRKLFSMERSVVQINQQRGQMASFFGKWLQFLLDRGFSPESFDVIDALPDYPSEAIQFFAAAPAK
jgi:uncharacterized protein